MHLESNRKGLACSHGWDLVSAPPRSQVKSLHWVSLLPHLWCGIRGFFQVALEFDEITRGPLCKWRWLTTAQKGMVKCKQGIRPLARGKYGQGCICPSAFTPGFFLLGHAGYSPGFQKLISSREPGRPQSVYLIFIYTFSLSAFSGTYECFIFSHRKQSCTDLWMVFFGNTRWCWNQVIYQHSFRVKISL